MTSQEIRDVHTDQTASQINSNQTNAKVNQLPQDDLPITTMLSGYGIMLCTLLSIVVVGIVILAISAIIVGYTSLILGVLTTTMIIVMGSLLRELQKLGWIKIFRSDGYRKIPKELKPEKSHHTKIVQILYACITKKSKSKNKE